MEATKDTGLLDTIVPPRLEDAGLEDCALPPDSIKEAFFKAASAIKSRATSVLTDEDEEDDCVHDPWPDSSKDASDSLVGVSPPEEGTADALVGVDPGVNCPGPCVAAKGGGLVEEGRDKVVVVGRGDVEEVEGEEKDCVDGVKGLGIGEKKKKEGNGEEEEEREGERPTLTEGSDIS